MRVRPHTPLLVSALLLLSACASGRSAGDPFQGGGATARSVRIHITNLNFNQVTVYGVTTGSRMRLGIVEGRRDATLTMTLPAATDLRLEMDFLAGPTCWTERVMAEPGDVFDVTVQPNGAGMSCRGGSAAEG